MTHWMLRLKRFSLPSWIISSLFLAAATVTQANQNYASCALITSEYLTTLQLYHRGLPLESALDALPKLSKKGKQRVKDLYRKADREGLLNVYADVNTNFARCSTLVYREQGIPSPNDDQYGYYYCAGENKVRFEMILNINQGKTYETLAPGLNLAHQRILGTYIAVVDAKGVIGAFDLTANSFKQCLQRLNNIDQSS